MPSPTPSPPFHALDVLWTLVRTDFKARYHGTVSGFAWALLKPAAMFVVLMAVFSYIFASDPQYNVNLIIGLFLWDFFSDGTKAGLGVLHTKGYLLSKTRVPPWLLVLASMSNALITIGVFSVVIAGYLLIDGSVPSLTGVLLAMWYFVQYCLMVVGFGMGASVLFLRYRDLNQVWDLALQAGFFIAPIIYPLRILPERMHFYLYIWPPTPIIQFTRDVLTDQHVPTLKAHALLAGQTAAILLIGVLVFRRLSPRAAEYL